MTLWVNGGGWKILKVRAAPAFVQGYLILFAPSARHPGPAGKQESGI